MMNKRSIGLTLTVSLIGLSFAGLALAGGGEHKGHRGGPGGVLSAHVFERFDANKDGQVARGEAEGEAQRLFDRMDADKDGALLPQEGEAGVRAVAAEEIEARFKALDANQDGKVTAEEAKLPPRFFERLDTNNDKAVTRDELQMGSHWGAGKGRFVFKATDANKDGKVTRAEATQAALTRFDRLDGNRDGAVTRAELDASMHRKGKHRGKHSSEGQSSDTKALKS
jgi:Ca2+-binding EF-hand superfamily protein